MLLLKTLALALVLPLFSEGQLPPAIMHKINEQTVRLVVHYDGLDSVGFANGSGFIINNDFVATCNHVYRENKSLHVKSAWVYYNKPSQGGRFRDSVPVDSNFKPTKRQYNFLLHEFDSKDPSDDFIILKIKGEINNNLPNYMKTRLKNGDSLYCYGMKEAESTPTTKRMVQDFSPIEFLCYYRDNVNQKGEFLLVFGDMDRGFSGAPVYNNLGQIVGVMASGLREFRHRELMDPLLNASSITPQQYHEIEDAYKAKTAKIGLVIDINYLLTRYIQTYM